jgi:hypothetical protein
MIALLIDADNFNANAWVDEAFGRLQADEKIDLAHLHIRRAYGSADSLKAVADSLRQWAIRPCTNLPLTKNTTDMALAVDAMALVHQFPGITQMVIASGDADYLPLVVRLRERGIRLVCVSERHKMNSEAVSAYAQVLYVGGNTVARPVAAVKKAVAPAKKAAAKTPTASAKATAAAPAAAKPVPAKKAATPAKREVAASEVLAAAPALRSGEWMPLGDIAKALHDHKLLGKTASSTKLLGRLAGAFELRPDKQPNQVRWLAVAGG